MQDLKWLDDYRAEKINETELHSEMIRLKRQLELIGGVDPETVTEYQETKERHDFLSEQAEDLRRSIKSLEKVIDDLDDKIQFQFDAAFKNINKEFGHFFKILFGGGKAELIQLTAARVRKDDQAEAETENLNGDDVEVPADDGQSDTYIAGVDITATPPGKKIKHINMLSGGERALTSIALICAIMISNPSPFVLLDEVDAALDESNADKFASILGELAEKTQFIVVSHNRYTMRRANVLYGVTMRDDGTSDLLSINLEEVDTFKEERKTKAKKAA